MQKPVNRVLLIHPFGIGDALFMTPVIDSLKKAGAEKVDLLLGSRTKTVFENNPSVNEIFVIDRDKMRSQSGFHNFQEAAKLILTLRKNRYDHLFDFSLSRQYAFLAFLFLSVPMRIGFNYKNRGIFLTHRMILEKSFSGKHVIEYYLELLRFVQVRASTRTIQFFLTKQDEREAADLLRSENLAANTPIMVAVPGGGESWGKDARLKRWPVAHFAKLFELINAQKSLSSEPLKVLILGGKNEYDLAESLRALNPGCFINLAGKLSLRGSAAVLKQSRLLVANDGGLVHVASALGTPTVAIFGPVDPKVYGPYPLHPARIAITNEGPECRPCYQNMRYNSACEHVECLTTLSPEGVFYRLTESGFFERIQKAPILS